MRSMLQTGPSLVVKIAYEDDHRERVIGYASGLTFRVSQGQKEIFTVDSPFPQEIGQGLGPSMVRGSMSVFLPKGQSLETLGLVPFRLRNRDTTNAMMAMSRYFHLRIYDRVTSELVMSADFVKVGDYSVSIQARSVVKCDLNFSGVYLTPGNSR